MPQGRKKVPFSGKAKKMQLVEKRQRKGVPAYLTTNKKGSGEGPSTSSKILKVNAQPTGSANSTRYALQFFRESEEEVRRQKEEAYLSLAPVNTNFEISIDTYFNDDFGVPKRPPWDYTMTRQALELQEKKYFADYIANLHGNYPDLSYFELNLETWRQFWRVLEMSDIILFIVDIRFPALMFPPTMYPYVKNYLKKDLILVLNKVDLAPPALVVAWKHYFFEKYPYIHVILFTSFPGYNLRSNPLKKSGLKVRRLKGRMRMAAEGAQQVLDVCKELVENEVNLSSWQEKITEEMDEEYDDRGVDVAEYINVKNTTEDRYQERKKFQDGILTIGCIGQPNVGKSSLLNALMGKKVVSVSRTPGHTKHFQTIFLTPNVRLCDCPGLVFPSMTPKSLQVIMGSFPIAQVRTPYTAIKFLAEHLDLIQLLKLQHPEGDDEWSAVDICNAWAKKRGFYTARSGRLDTYRAGNQLLRMTLEGKICICLQPPGYSVKKDLWETHEDIATVMQIQAQEVFGNENDHGDEYRESSDLEDDIETEHQIDSDSNAGTDGGNSYETDDSDEAPGPSADNKFAILDSSS